MRRSVAAVLLLSLLLCFALSDIGAETRKPTKKTPKPTKFDGPEYGMDEIKADFAPTCQWIEVLVKASEPNIIFCGQQIPFEASKDTITLTIGTEKMPVKAGEKPAVVDIPVGDKVLNLGLVYEKETWHYFNAKLKRVSSVADKFLIYGFDADNDGEYFVPKRDGMIWPGQRAVVPWRGGKFWFNNKMVEVFIVEGQAEMKFEEIKAPKEDLEALLHINLFRVGAGLHPMGYDAELSDKCRQHSAYVSANGGENVDDPYRQNPGNPGASAQGASIAGSSLYWLLDEPAPQAIAAHLGHIFYRSLYIRGNVENMGIGHTETIFVFNSSVASPNPIEYRYPVMTPGPGQIIPYLLYNPTRATFDPVDPRPGGGGGAFPAMLTWDWGEKGELVDAKVFMIKKGKEVAQQVVSSGPNKPAFPNYFPDNRGAIAVIPLNGYDAKTQYRVVITYKLGGQEKVADWTFETGAGN